MLSSLTRPKLRVFTWHIHGSYLYYLSQGNFDLYIPVNAQKTEGYYGRGETYPFAENVIEVAAEEVRNIEFDVILFQTDENYLKDQYEVLSESQRKLPRVYLEHDPPWDHPINARHPVTDSEVVLVHVTHFNRLMWNNHRLLARVITHGVVRPEVSYTGTLKRGLVVINNLPARARMLGLDIFKEVRKHIPIDLVGMGNAEYGIGEVLHSQLPGFMSEYRFLFNPIRYNSLGLEVCEAMMLGMPVVALASAEMAVTIKDAYSGYVHTHIDYLIDRMRFLLDDHEAALTMGGHAREMAMQKFNINRFTEEWGTLFQHVIDGDYASEYTQLMP